MDLNSAESKAFERSRRDELLMCCIFSYHLRFVFTDEAIISVCISQKMYTILSLCLSRSHLLLFISIWGRTTHLACTQTHTQAQKHKHWQYEWPAGRYIWVCGLYYSQWGHGEPWLTRTITVLSFSPYDHYLSLQLSCRAFSIRLFVIQSSK